MKHIRRHWKTTAFGLMLSVFTALQTVDFKHITEPKSIFGVFVAVGIGVFGYMVKDDVLRKP